MENEQSCGKGWSERCPSAKGTKCECACGGRNHGKRRAPSASENATPMRVNRSRAAYQFPGLYGFPSKCGLAIYKQEGRAVVVFTELPDNPGTSVTNAIELLATQVCSEMLLHYRPADIRFVEHYPADRHRQKETYDLVQLEWDGSQFKSPRWSRLDVAATDSLTHSIWRRAWEV